jgi:hypothetical protein
MDPRETHYRPPVLPLDYHRPAPARGHASVHWTGVMVALLILVLPVLVAAFLFIWFR